MSKDDSLNSELFEKEFKELCEVYRKSIPEKSSDVQKCIDEIIQAFGKKQPPPFKPLEKLVHKLAGSSGSYGFHILSDLSRMLEKVITDGRIHLMAPEACVSFLRFWYAIFSEQARIIAHGKSSHITSEKLLALLNNHLESKVPKREDAA